MSQNNRDIYESDDAARFYSGTNFVDNERHIVCSELTNPNARILDLGCGTGRTTRALQQAGYRRVIGVDYSNKMIDVALSKHPDLTFRVGDATCLDFPDRSFDAVLFLYQGIDAIPSRILRARAYDEIFRVLRCGGTFIHSAHNIFWLNRGVRTTWLPLASSLLDASVFSGTFRTYQHEYGEETVAFRRPSTVISELSRSGFKGIRKVPSRQIKYAIFGPYWHFVCQRPGHL